MTTFRTQAEPKIDWTSPIAKYLDFAVLGNHGSGNALTEVLTGASVNFTDADTQGNSLVFNADGSVGQTLNSTQANSGIRTGMLSDVLNAKINNATLLVNSDYLIVSDLRTSSSTGKTGHFVSTVGTGSTGDNISLTLTAWDSGKVNCANNINYQALGVLSPIATGNRVYAIRYSAANKEQQHYENGISIGSATFTGTPNWQTGVGLHLGVGGGSNSALYSTLIFVKSNGAFTTDEINEILNDPYQVFQTYEDELDEYCLEFNKDVSGLSSHVLLDHLTSQTISVEIGISRENLATAGWTQYLCGQVGGNQANITVGDTNLTYSTRITNFKVDGVAIASGTTNSLTLLKRGSVVTFDMLTTGGAMILGNSNDKARCVNLGIGYVKITDSSGLLHWNFDRTSGQVVTDYIRGNSATLVNMADTNYKHALTRTTVHVNGGSNEYVDVNAAFVGERNKGALQVREVVVHGILTTGTYQSYDQTTTNMLIRGNTPWTDRSLPPVDGIHTSTDEALEMGGTIEGTTGLPIVLQDLYVRTDSSKPLSGHQWAQSFNYYVSDCFIHSPSDAAIATAFQSNTAISNIRLNRSLIKAAKTGMSFSKLIHECIVDDCVMYAGETVGSYNKTINLAPLSATGGDLKVTNTVIYHTGSTGGTSSVIYSRGNDVTLNNVQCNVIDSSNNFLDVQTVPTITQNEVTTGVNMATWFDANYQLTQDAQTELTGAGWNGTNIAEWAWATTSIITALLSGTVVDSTEVDVVNGGKTLLITLSGGTWEPDGTGFDAQRQGIINGITSAQSELFGWNNEVRDNEVVTSVVRTSDTVVTITLSASLNYDITSTETITVTVPSASMSGTSDVVADNTFTITPTATGFIIAWASKSNNLIGGI